VQHYMNLRRIDRLRRIAKILTFGGLGLMVVALLVSLQDTGNTGVALGLSVIGLAGSQMGTMMMRRWPENGRSDQVFDAALKGLDGRHALYHYLLGCRHALFTPRGVLALFPVGEPGRYEARDGVLWRTRLKRGVAAGKPTDEGRLASQAEAEASDLEQRLSRRLPERAEWDVLPVLVFVHPEARLDADGFSPPAVHLKKLKDFVRNHPRHAPLAKQEADALSASLAAFLISG